ncbi:hypothetical protein AMECASPLE_013727, partial [Ameca splendens]
EELDAFCRPQPGSQPQPNTNVYLDWTASPEVCFPHQAASSSHCGPDSSSAVMDQTESRRISVLIFYILIVLIFLFF